MNATDVGTAVLAVCAAIGVVVAITGWFFKRGADERGVEIALRENTSAIRGLTDAFTVFRTEALHEFRTLDVRVTRLEAAPNGNSSHRDIRAPGGHSAG
jgi:hypothetical protein